MIQIGKYIFGLSLQEEVLFLTMMSFMDQIWIVFGAEIDKLSLFDAFDKWIQIFFYDAFVSRHSVGQILKQGMKKFWTSDIPTDGKTEMFDFYSCRVYLATYCVMLYPAMTVRQGWMLIPWLMMTGVEVRAPRLYFRIYLWFLVIRYLNYCLDERLKQIRCKSYLQMYEVYKKEALVSRRRAKGIRTHLLNKSPSEILKFVKLEEPILADILNDYRRDNDTKSDPAESIDALDYISSEENQDDVSMKKLKGNHSIWSTQLYSTQDVPKVTDCITRQLSGILLDLAAYIELSHSKRVISENQPDANPQLDPLPNFMTPNNLLQYDPNQYNAGFLINYSTTKPRYPLPEYLTSFPNIFQKNRKSRASILPTSLHLISPDSTKAVFDHNVTYIDILLGLEDGRNSKIKNTDRIDLLNDVMTDDVASENDTEYDDVKLNDTGNIADE